MVERVVRNDEVRGSIPLGSTKIIRIKREIPGSRPICLPNLYP